MERIITAFIFGCGSNLIINIIKSKKFFLEERNEDYKKVKIENYKRIIKILNKFFKFPPLLKIEF